jgi:hypothetical protein
MLQSTEEYQTFANLAIEDNGVRFLHSMNQKKKTKIDVLPSGSSAVAKKNVHFCTCNK